MLNLLINKADLKAAVEYSIKGMVAIFVVIGIIIIAVSLLNYFNDKAAKKAQNKNKDQDN